MRLSKADEKALLIETVHGLPEGYARDILQDLLPEMEQAITSDFGFIPFKQRAQESQEYITERCQRSAELGHLKEQIKELERTRFQLTNGLNELRTMARKFASL